MWRYRPVLGGWPPSPSPEVRFCAGSPVESGECSCGSLRRSFLNLLARAPQLPAGVLEAHRVPAQHLRRGGFCRRGAGVEVCGPRHDADVAATGGFGFSRIVGDRPRTRVGEAERLCSIGLRHECFGHRLTSALEERLPHPSRCDVLHPLHSGIHEMSSKFPKRFPTVSGEPGKAAVRSTCAVASVITRTRCPALRQR